MPRHHAPALSDFKSKCSATLSAYFARVLGPAITSADDDTMKRSLASRICRLVPWRPWVKTSWPRRCDANKDAAALEVYNAEFSSIYRVPPELIDRVLNYISVADIMSLRLSSRRLRSRTRRQEPTLHDKNDLRARLRRDYYFKLAEAESTNVMTLSELLCSYCQQPHPSSAFQRNQAISSPHTRQCMGMTRIFRGCSHISLNRVEILAVLFWSVGYGTAQNHRLCDRCNMSFFASRALNNGGNVTYGSDCILSEDHISSTVYRVALREDLERLAAPVCAHMRTDDPEFLERILSSPCGSWGDNFNDNRPINDVFADSYVSSIMRICCQKERCNSMIDIDRGAGHLPGPVKIRIRRELGRMVDVLDPKWLIQLET
jgi:hypothetical protein